MNSKILFGVLALTLVLVGAAADWEPLTEQEVSFAFSKWMKDYDKQYQDAAEFDIRLSAFKANLEVIQMHQSNSKRTFDMGVNQFSDLTAAEFAEQFLGSVPQDIDYLRAKNEVYLSTRGNPSAVDWSKKPGIVTPVKYQGGCGSCWAFSTTGAVESAYAIATGKQTSLSEQQLVDCSFSSGNHGCAGGNQDNSFNWIISHRGLCSETAHPYTARDGKCASNCTSAVTITGFVDVPRNQESQLESAVVRQPVSILLDGGDASWQHYKSGIVSATSCGTVINHAVLLVGYGTDNGHAYWKIKNSWSTAWGEQGYIRLQKGVSGPGTCAMCSYPSYPTGARKAVSHQGQEDEEALSDNNIASDS